MKIENLLREIENSAEGKIKFVDLSNYMIRFDHYLGKI